MVDKKVPYHWLFSSWFKSPSNTFVVDQYSTFVYVWFPYVWYFVKPQHAIKTFIFRKPSINGVHFPAKVTAIATTNIRIVTNSFWYHAHFFPSIQRRRSLCLDNDDDYYITNHWQLVYKHFLCKVICDWWLAWDLAKSKCRLHAFSSR